MSSQNIVKLNIGGTVFQTSKSTLTRHEGFFKTMLETDVPVAKDDSGCIFIDRDPTHFRSILNFMRDGHVELPKSEEALKEIQTEAQYYLLDGLMELCNRKLEKRNVSKNCDGIHVIETDTEFLRIISYPRKPVLVIYYPKDNTGINTGLPSEFNIPIFLDKWRCKFDIYFRSHNVDREGFDPYEYHSFWKIYYNNSAYPHTANYYPNNDSFMSQVEESLDKFITEHNINF